MSDDEGMNQVRKGDMIANFGGASRIPAPPSTHPGNQGTHPTMNVSEEDQGVEDGQKSAIEIPSGFDSEGRCGLSVPTTAQMTPNLEAFLSQGMAAHGYAFVGETDDLVSRIGECIITGEQHSEGLSADIRVTGVAQSHRRVSSPKDVWMRVTVDNTEDPRGVRVKIVKPDTQHWTIINSGRQTTRDVEYAYYGVMTKGNASKLCQTLKSRAETTLRNDQMAEDSSETAWARMQKMV